MEIRLAREIQSDSIVDGEGLRTVIWTQGCSHNCKGCHNPQTHDFNGGFRKNVDDLKKELSYLQLQDGITLSGGDPFFQVDACLEIAEYAQSIGLNVWCYTGFTFEALLAMGKINKKILELLYNIDVLVDGKFNIDLKSYDYKYRGSSNQRLIDVKKSLSRNTIVNYELKDDVISSFVSRKPLYV